MHQQLQIEVILSETLQNARQLTNQCKENSCVKVPTQRIIHLSTVESS